MTIAISSAFDSGNIEVVDAADAQAPKLAIRRDNNSDFFQWFHFRLTGAADADMEMAIVNAGEAAYPAGWEGYRAVASYDREDWFRVETDYRDGVLTIRHCPSHDSVYYAYFAPYSLERHADLIAWCQTSPFCGLRLLGRSLDGRDIDLLTVGEAAADKPVLWVIARQHPGESMAEWWMEGFLERLLDEDDPQAGFLRENAVLHIVPNMNPDGSFRGHLRTNAAGANLNREWLEPSMERSPEVYLVREEMHRTGVDFSLDVHGDEALPYNFIASTVGIPSLKERQVRLLARYREMLMAVSPDFQTEHGYPDNAPGRANLSMCSNYIAETFGALSMTLEMPFKDNADRPDLYAGWSPERARILGAANLDAMAAVLRDLRG